MGYLRLMTRELSVAVDEHGVWQLCGTAAEEFGLVNEFLGYLADRNFSPRTCRAYAYDLLAFARWLEWRGFGTGGRECRCAAAVLDRVSGGDAAGSAGWQRVLDPRRPQSGVCAGDDQSAVGGDLELVRVPGDA